MLSFSKSVELHDKVIGHYLNIRALSELESLPAVPNKIAVVFHLTFSLEIVQQLRKPPFSVGRGVL